MIQKVRTSFTFTSTSFILSNEVTQHLTIKHSNVQIGSPKMQFKMRSLKVKSATNLHTSVLGPFQILEMSDKYLIYELQFSQCILESNKKKEGSVLCQCFSSDDIEIRFFFNKEIKEAGTLLMCIFLFFPSLVILLLNHRARQNSSQWLVGYVVTQTRV